MRRTVRTIALLAGLILAAGATANAHEARDHGRHDHGRHEHGRHDHGGRDHDRGRYERQDPDFRGHRHWRREHREHRRYRHGYYYGRGYVRPDRMPRWLRHKHGFRQWYRNSRYKRHYRLTWMELFEIYRWERRHWYRYRW